MGDNPKLDEDVFGICLACSYACHADHDLFELYTKREFRCDCGTGKMKKCKCTLNAEKEAVNDLNKYNHNFIGKYCLCAQPYPNPEGKDEEMVQCVVCEDWFHENCLGCRFPDDEDYAEMICKSCMQSNQFLWFYQTEKVKIRNEDNGTLKVDVVDVEPEAKKEEIKIEVANKSETANEELKLDDKNEQQVDEPANGLSDSQNSTTANGADKKVANGDHPVQPDSSECKLAALKLRLTIDLHRNGTTFWDEGWRSQLCKCDACLAMYAANKVQFLTNEHDTVHHYEEKGKENYQKISQYEQGLNEISKMGHVVSIDAITGEFRFSRTV